MQTNRTEKRVIWGHFGTVAPDNTSDYSTKNFQGESYALKIHALLEPARRRFESKHGITLDDKHYDNAIAVVVKELCGSIFHWKVIDGLKDKTIHKILENSIVRQREHVLEILKADFL